MTRAVTWCLVGSVLFLRSFAAGQNQDTRHQVAAQPSPLTLTNEHPIGSFPLDPKTFTRAPSILALRITKVVNPEHTGVGIAVYLALPASSSSRRRILIGDVGLYPPDRPAGFVLHVVEAFNKLRTTSKPNEVEL